MTLHGLDVSHYQQGLSLSKTGLDFVIAKATEGTSFVDPACNSFVNGAKNAEMLWGTYHFYRGNPSAEADYYLKNIADYVGHGLMVLDFEYNTTDVAGAREWLHRVHDKTGIWPLLYASQSVTTAHDWSSVADDVALWVARYNDEIGPTGAWDFPVMWQYTSSGKVNGWSGAVDLDTFYGDAAAWHAFATGDSSSQGGNDMAETNVPNFEVRMIESNTRIEEMLKVQLSPDQEKVALDRAADINANRKY